MYQVYRKDSTAGRDAGTNVVGNEPDRSPGDTSDLPPAGEQLLNVENDEAPRAEKLRNEFYKEFGDVTDAVSQEAGTVQQILERPAPTGHPEVPVPARPEVAPEAALHGTPDAGTVAEMGLVLGVMGIQAGRWVRHRLAELRGR
jgi:hypothetical protein